VAKTVGYFTRANEKNKTLLLQELEVAAKQAGIGKTIASTVQIKQETQQSAELFPAQREKAMAEATTAQTEASFAPATAQLDVASKGQQLTKQAGEIAMQPEEHKLARARATSATIDANIDAATKDTQIKIKKAQLLKLNKEIAKIGKIQPLTPAQLKEQKTDATITQLAPLLKIEGSGASDQFKQIYEATSIPSNLSEGDKKVLRNVEQVATHATYTPALFTQDTGVIDTWLTSLKGTWAEDLQRQSVEKQQALQAYRYLLILDMHDKFGASQTNNEQLAAEISIGPKNVKERQVAYAALDKQLSAKVNEYTHLLRTLGNQTANFAVAKYTGDPALLAIKQTQLSLETQIMVGDYEANKSSKWNQSTAREIELYLGLREKLDKHGTGTQPMTKNELDTVSARFEAQTNKLREIAAKNYSRKPKDYYNAVLTEQIPTDKSKSAQRSDATLPSILSALPAPKSN
jgi:hypothetical protein